MHRSINKSYQLTAVENRFDLFTSISFIWLLNGYFASPSFCEITKTFVCISVRGWNCWLSGNNQFEILLELSETYLNLTIHVEKLSISGIKNGFCGIVGKWSGCNKEQLSRVITWLLSVLLELKQVPSFGFCVRVTLLHRIDVVSSCIQIFGELFGCIIGFYWMVVAF